MRRLPERSAFGGVPTHSDGRVAVPRSTLEAVKRSLAVLLRAFGPLRGLLGFAVRLGAPHHRVGVLALIRDAEGRLLLGEHTFRPWNPWGLLGGWMETGEPPEDAVRRELEEELGAEARADVGRLVWAGQHRYRGEPPGVSLIFECSLRGGLPSILPLELLQLRWMPESEARSLLRPIEIAALDASQSPGRAQPLAG